MSNIHKVEELKELRKNELHADENLRNECNQETSLENFKTVLKAKRPVDNAEISTIDNSYHQSAEKYTNKMTEKKNIFSHLTTNTKKLEFSNGNFDNEVDVINFSLSSASLSHSDLDMSKQFSNEIKTNSFDRSLIVAPDHTLNDSNNYKPASKKRIPNEFDYWGSLTNIILWNSDKTAFRCFPVYQEKDLNFTNFASQPSNITNQDDDCDTQQELLTNAVRQNYHQFVNGINENTYHQSSYKLQPVMSKNKLSYYKILKPIFNSSKPIPVKKDTLSYKMLDYSDEE